MKIQLLILLTALCMTGCSTIFGLVPEDMEAPVNASMEVRTEEPTTAAIEETSETPHESAGQVIGTVVRFSNETTSVDVTINEDNPAVRDFLSMLPLTLTLEEFAGREKISYLPRELRHRGSPGSDPESGDLIYFVPWGNLGFYYNAEGIGYSNDTIHLGTYD